MRFRVTLIDGKTRQRTERIVEATDERAAGWSILQAGHQLIGVEALGASTAYPASTRGAAPAESLGPPEPPRHANHIKWIAYYLLIAGTPMMARAIGSVVNHQTMINAMEQQYEPMRKYLGETSAGTNPLARQINDRYDERNTALGMLVLGLALAGSGVGVWYWLKQTQRRWDEWKSSYDRAPPPDTPTPA